MANRINIVNCYRQKLLLSGKPLLNSHYNSLFYKELPPILGGGGRFLNSYKKPIIATYFNSLPCFSKREAKLICFYIFRGGYKSNIFLSINKNIIYFNMPSTFEEIKSAFEEHLVDTNPHNVNYTQIWGLYNLDNTSDANKPISNALQAELEKKMNISDIYDSTESDDSLDLTILPWSSSQGYAMKNVIDTYQSQDTAELENRILWCETNV